VADYIATARKLTKRQAQMLGMIANGLSQVDITRELFLSDSTVKSTLDSARKRLGAKNTPHAVALAMRSGEIQ
jgi:DNA-binding CsgD family transcriptional regulator